LTSRHAYLEAGLFNGFEFRGIALSTAVSEGALTAQAFTFLLVAAADIVVHQGELQCNNIA